MRPRVIPAENAVFFFLTLPRGRGFNEAAGNPRGKQPRHDARQRQQAASMRPRVIPAENRSKKAEGIALGGRFNEAAGNPRGKRAR